MKPRLWIAASALIAGAVLGAPPAFEQVGTVEHAPIGEMSGIVRSVTYPDVWWVHNDSGDEPRLFAIDAEGKPIVPTFVRKKFHVGPKEKEGTPFWPGLRLHLAANIDWEDIALHDGHLYVADVGNNGNARRDMGVYVVPEPNPRATTESRVLRHIPVRYPEQETYPAKLWHYDCEAVCVAGGKLHFLTKHRAPGQIARGERGTRLYRLDTEHTDRVNVLTFLDSRPDLALPTAADVSPDGERLAVLTLMAVWVFEKPSEGDRWLAGRSRRFMLDPRKTRQAEGLCWDDDATLRLCDEQRDVFRVPLSAFSDVKSVPPGDQPGD